jgi:hypothetical protein
VTDQDRALRTLAEYLAPSLRYPLGDITREKGRLLGVLGVEAATGAARVEAALREVLGTAAPETAVPGRKTHVYRLNVTLPPEASDPSWEPDAWLDELPPYPEEGRNVEGDGFRWPRQRRFLSQSGVSKQAALFRKYGAEVTIERSAPVEWPQDQDAAAAAWKED